MFTLLAILSAIVIIGGGIWFFNDDLHRIFSAIVVVVGVIILVGAFQTPQGQLQWKQLVASSQSGNWLVIDNSGGETLRHWVLEGGYTESSSQSDGWQFYDTNGNLCYVSGDAFVMKINQPLEDFLVTYKQRYHIPEELPALK